MAEAGVPGHRRERIEHIVVLMLENRSFDHLLGFLEHPDPAFPTLVGADVSCPVDPRNPDSRRVQVSPTATPHLGNDPDHSHQAVMLQITGGGRGFPMSGFVDSYRRRIAKERLAPPPPMWRRAGEWLLHHGKVLWNRLCCRPGPILAKPDEIMRCFAHSDARVLGRLALEYAVMVNWHASLPGETWPNRQFAHAATSHGTTNIKVDFYDDVTVFDRLEQAEVSYGIYQDGIAQVWCYPKLWWGRPRGSEFSRFHDMDQLFTDIDEGTLPAYSFIEPNHGYGRGEGNSQHPSNNTLEGTSFEAGERLIARIHDALRTSKAGIFERTLLLITYDEHGGFFDREPPRRTTAPDDYRDGSGFPFDITGVRVPAVAVSPLVRRGAVVDDLFDHASIPATVLRQFAPTQRPLTARDAAAQDLLACLPLLDVARTDLPDFGPQPLAGRLESFTAQRLDDFQGSLVDLAGAVHNATQRFGAEDFEDVEFPPFEPDTDTRLAAEKGVLIAGSEADRIVESIVAEVETGPVPHDPGDAEFPEEEQP